MSRPDWDVLPKYEVTIENKVIDPAEPLFILRGQDMLAPIVVRLYAELLQSHGLAGASEVKAHAAAMERWQPRKMPD